MVPLSHDGVVTCATELRRLLGFDPERDVHINDDGSPEAVDHAITRLRFLGGMISNGRTEVRDAATGRRLGRTDPCIPTNIDPGRSMENIERRIVQLESERATRKMAT